MLRRLLKIIFIIILVLVVLMVAATFTLNSSYVQNRLMKYAVSALSEKLQTKVDIDSVSVDVASHNVRLHGLDIQDLQQRELLQIEELSADIQLIPLLSKDVEVSGVYVKGVKANIVKPADSLANYQFIIDAFKKDDSQKLADVKKNADKEKKAKFNLKEVVAEQLEADYNGQTIKVEKAVYEQDEQMEVKAEHISYEMNDKKRQKATVEEASYVQGEKKSATAEHIRYEWNDGKVHSLTVENASYEDDGVKTATAATIRYEWRDGKVHVATAEKASYKDNGNKSGAVENIRYAWIDKKDHTLTVKKAEFEEKQKTSVSLHDVHYVTDNNQPRKNTGKPHRGAFDAGHLDVAANINILFDQLGKETFKGHLSARLKDQGSGLDLKNIDSRFCLSPANGKMQLKDAVVELAQTKLRIPSASITLPSKKKGRLLTYHAPTISGTTKLCDISKPFAPVLKDFTVPLSLTTSMEGDKDGIRFGGVSVATTDKKLTIAANGRLTHLKGKHKLIVHFDVNSMKAKKGTPRKIVELFPLKKKFMMKQLYLLGDISYQGSFDVVWKRQTFRGTLNSLGGAILFDFSLDGKNKYVSGNMNTSEFALGKVLDLPDIGNAAVDADFKFDISKERTAEVRKVKGGKLPIGKVSGIVKEANYKKIQVRNLLVDIKTDGKTAEGSIENDGKVADLSCDFSFSDTEKLSDMKVRPHVKFHNPLDWLKKNKNDRKEKKEKAERKEKDKKRPEETNEGIGEKKGKDEVKEETEESETKPKKKKIRFPIGNRKNPPNL